jgi:predicted dehydrogenase
MHALHAPVEDEADIDLVFPNATGRIELSWASSHRVNDGEIIGTHGRIRIEDDRLAIQSGDETRIVPYGERLSDSSYHPEWFQALFTRVRADDHRQEGLRNLREAAMLIDTLFAAYQPAEPALRPETASAGA